MKTRSIFRRLRMPVLSAAALLGYAGSATAQNPSTWSLTATNGNWNNAANWDSPPTSGFDTDIIFQGTANLNTIQNITAGSTPFQLTNLSLMPSTTDTVISGGSLQFGPGNSPTGISYGTASGRLLINSPVSFTSAATIDIGVGANNAAGAEVFFNGAITNPVGNTLTLQTVPAATLAVITSANNVNFAGTWAQTASTLTQLGAHNAMWRNTAITFAGTCAVTTGTTTAVGYGVVDAGYNQQIGAAGGTGQFLVGTTDSASTTLLGFLNTNTTLSGPAGLAGFNFNSHFGKVGTGTLTVSGENASFNMQMSIRQGNLLLNGGLGALVNSLPTAGQISVYGGGQLRLNNTTAPAVGGTPMNAQGRISDTRSIRLAGGTLRLDGPSVASVLGSTEQTGLLRVLAGQSVVVVNANAAQPVRLKLLGVDEAGVDLNRGGQVAFAGTGLGNAPGNGVAQITFDTAPASVNGLLPWAISQTAYTGSTTAATNTFAFDTLAVLGVNGVTPLTTFADNDISSATQNVRITTAQAPVGGGSANSLTLGAAGSLTLGGALNITSGAVMNTNLAGSVAGGSLATTGRMYLNSSGANILTVASPISASSVSKGGSGTVAVTNLNLTGTNPVISVNAGTMTFGGAVTVGGGAPIYQVASAGSIGGLTSVTGTLRGNGTVLNSVNMNAGSLLGGSTLSSDVGGPTGTTGAAPGTMTVNGTLSFTGLTNPSVLPTNTGTRLRFYLTSAFGGTQTQGLIVANTLDLTGATPSAQISIQPHSIALANTDNAPVYDFDAAQNYTWTLIQTSNPIIGFNAAAFNIDLTNFANVPQSGAGQFSVGTQGNNLVLNFTSAIPEPSLMGLAAFSLIGLARLRRRS